jgi:hypothetical protein
LLFWELRNDIMRMLIRRMPIVFGMASDAEMRGNVFKSTTQ